jgi:hypothetical protein
MKHRYELFRESVIVTGTHYSMSSLMGRIIAASPDFNLVHEPLNHRPTLGYATIPTEYWYQYFGQDVSAKVAGQLQDIQFGHGAVRRGVGNLAHIRQPKDFARIAKYMGTGILHGMRPKRAVFKDPFLCFSARHLQENFGLYIVLTVRHPCGFAESLMRRGTGFDFNDFLQEDLLDALPDLAEDIHLFAREEQPVLDQAALLWSVVYSFAKRYYLPHHRTTFIRQEDLALDPAGEVDRVMAHLASTVSPEMESFINENLTAKTPLDFTKKSKSYVKRDSRKTTDKWRNRLTQVEIDHVMERAGESAAFYGYKMDGDSALGAL